MKKYITKRNLVVYIIGPMAALYLALASQGVNNIEDLKEFIDTILNNWDIMFAFALTFLGYITNDSFKSKIYDKLFGGDY